MSQARSKTATKRNTKSTLSLGTQKRLKKLLQVIAKYEQNLELQRQFLASNENMEPYALFQRIDRNEDSFITSIELLNFLRDNGIHNMTEADCYYLVKFFDSDEDGRLNYPDFMQMVLPCDNPVIRAVATQRPNNYINKFDYLTLDVEKDLSKLILTELELHRKSEKLKQELESALDFSADAVYNAIDDWGYGFIDTRNMKSFFRNNKFLASDQDCIALIRRMDLDADSKLLKEEFLSGIKPQEPYSKMIVRERLAKKDELRRIKNQNKVDQSKGKRVNKKAEEGNEQDAVREQALDRSFREVLSTSPLKHRVQLDLYGEGQCQSPQKSPLKQHSAIKSRNSKLQTPNRTATKLNQSNKKQLLSPMMQTLQPLKQSKQPNSLLQSKNMDSTTIASPSKFKQSGMTSSIFKTPQKFSQSKGPNQPFDAALEFSQSPNTLMNSQNTAALELQIISIFRDQLELEKRLETTKIDLSLRTDFNLIDAFRIFDQDGKGWITVNEIKEGLNAYNIFAQHDDIQLYMRRYDKDEDGKVKYSEFCDSFLPNDSFHASLLAKKAPLHMYHINLPRDKIFYQETKELFQLCWKTHLLNENEAEKIRVRLSGQFNPYHAFQAIDFKGDGYIDKEEIKDLLMKYNVYVSEKEICALIERYDRKRDGRITYSEFVEELTSKTGGRQ